MTDHSGTRPPIAVTMGEPAGIGGEITIRAWLQRESRRLPPFLCINSCDYLHEVAELLGVDLPIAEINDPGEAVEAFGVALPVLAQNVPASLPGHPNVATAPAVLESVERAVELALARKVDGIVTNPIHKQILYAAGFRFPGHTEWLGDMVSAPEAPIMMLVCPGLRVIPATVHLPISAVPGSLNIEDLVRLGTRSAGFLRSDFAIKNPAIAIAALNPHAGESGALGREEIEIIKPAVDAMAKSGINVSGPHPADSLFHAEARTRYDAIICMYHDQALIPLKTIDFMGGVNVTLGLPIIRTSPDHGTALDLAGKGVADPSSLAAAIAMAAQISQARARCLVIGSGDE